VLGYLVFKSGYVPRALGILVMIASLGYLIDSIGGFLSTGYNANVAQFTFVGEVHVVDGALLLDADPAWAGAINTVLVAKGVRVSELCRARKDVTLAAARF
jgi:hypothetical protein